MVSIFAIVLNMLSSVLVNEQSIAQNSEIESVNQLFSDAEKKLKSGNLNEAESDFRKIISKARSENHAHQIFRSHVRLGDVMTRKGNLEKSGSKKALKKFQQAFESYHNGIVFGVNRLRAPASYIPGWLRDP